MISAHKRDTRKLPSWLCHEDIVKTAIYEPGSAFLSDTDSSRALNLDAPAPRTVRNKFLIAYKPPSLWQFVTAAQMN